MLMEHLCLFHLACRISIARLPMLPGASVGRSRGRRSAPDKPDHRVDQKTVFSVQKRFPCRELEGRSPSKVAGGVGGGSPPPIVGAFGLDGNLAWSLVLMIGVRAKLYSFTGEERVHSKVRASQGFLPAGFNFLLKKAETN